MAGGMPKTVLFNFPLRMLGQRNNCYLIISNIYLIDAVKIHLWKACNNFLP
jgi:hypothetical protein